MNARLKIAVAVIIVGLMAASCGDGRRQNPSDIDPTATPPVDGSLPVTLGEAQSLLAFPITLPSFVPDGASATPSLSVLTDSNGAAFRLEALYEENDAAPFGVRRLRMRVTQAAETEMVISDSEAVIAVHGVPVGLALGPFTKERNAEASAVWNGGGVGYAVEFYWLPSSQANEGVVTDDMRAEALRVIESMIEQGQ